MSKNNINTIMSASLYLYNTVLELVKADKLEIVDTAKSPSGDINTYKCPESVTLKMLQDEITIPIEPCEDITILWNIYYDSLFRNKIYENYNNPKVLQFKETVPDANIIALIEKQNKYANEYTAKQTNSEDKLKQKSSSRNGRSRKAHKNSSSHSIKNLSLQSLHKTLKHSSSQPQQGGTILPTGENQRLMHPRWANGVSTLYKIMPAGVNANIRVYGTSLPVFDHYDRQRTFTTLAWYMYYKEIAKLVSLQGCGTIPPPPANNLARCPPAPGANMEMEIWDSLKLITNANATDANIRFINNTISDMTAGTLTSWNVLRRLDVDGIHNKTLIHCLAGFGRTGTAILYYLLRTFSRLPGHPFNPNVPYMGLGSSRAMYDFLFLYLQNNIVLDNSASIYQAQINGFDVDHVSIEVFRTGTVFHTQLLVTRINLIIAMLCVEHGSPLAAFYTFVPANLTPDNIFTNGETEIDATRDGLVALAAANRFGFVL